MAAGRFPGRSTARSADVASSGNVALRPEEADTSTIGFVLTPGRFDNRFRFSADYYEIEIENGIQGGNRDAGHRKLLQHRPDCQYLQGTNPAFSPNGFPGYPRSHRHLRAVLQRALLFGERHRFAVDYTIPLSTGAVTLRLISTHAIDTIVTTPPTTPGNPTRFATSPARPAATRGSSRIGPARRIGRTTSCSPMCAVRSCSRRKAGTSPPASSTSRRRRPIRRQPGYNPL